MNFTDSEFRIALDQYDQALTDFENRVAANKQETLHHQSKESLADEIYLCLDVLIARDKIQNYLIGQEPSIRKFVPKLSQLDQKLKEQLKMIERTFPLDEWQKILDPPTSAWWWQGKSPDVAPSWTRLDWLWKMLTIPTLTINFALVVSISLRFLAGRPDALGAFAVIGQSVIAMLAAGVPLTQAGQKAIDQGLEALKLPKYRWPEAKLGIATVVLFSLLGLRASLPNIAKYYVQRGIEARDKSQTASALADYKRAIELDPNNMEAHYYLAAVYEDLLDFEQANSEYRIAMLGGCVEAFNNLGRLYLVENDDAATAAALLTRAQAKDADARCTSVTPKRLEYTLLKNLGWARFKQERYVEAENFLRAAIDLEPEEAAPYCLLAQVIDTKSLNESQREVSETWSNCLAYATTLRPEEDEWLHIAEQKLKNTSLKD